MVVWIAKLTSPSALLPTVPKACPAMVTAMAVSLGRKLLPLIWNFVPAGPVLGVTVRLGVASPRIVMVVVALRLARLAV